MAKPLERILEALVALESKRKAPAFRPDLEDVLSDASRSGAPPTFSPETLCQIIALVCEDPSLPGRPVTTWTGRELAGECIKRKTVPPISVSHINHWLRQANERQAPTKRSRPGEVKQHRKEPFESAAIGGPRQSG